jgi:hypothetical protein
MSCAWEVTPEDVRYILANIDGNEPDDAEIVRVHNAIDGDAVEASALHGDTMEEQVEYANQEIRRQIEQDIDYPTP